MASVFGHAIAALAIARAAGAPVSGTRLWLLVIACSVLPDIDVVGFWLGVPYGHLFGHRGLTHSLLFAVAVGWGVVRAFCADSSRTGALTALFAVVTASHGVLDAMTNGGLGVAFFAPFDETRYFLPWRPLAVSPIGVWPFFSTQGLRVLESEALWIGVPAGALLAVRSMLYPLRR